ncbi:MAG: hypothetical protein ACYC99_06155 [Candidatus Geothermincolia bacterium]
MQEKETIRIPGPARAIYWTYLGVLALVLYSGFYRFHIFTSGWRYPWSNALMIDFNWALVWALALLAVVYLYYALVGRPEGSWSEPLGIFRVALALLAIWFWFLTYAVNRPFSFLSGMVNAFGGVAGTWKVYELCLWLVVLLNVIYVYARWAKSERFPRLAAKKT